MTEQTTTSAVPDPERLAEHLQPKIDELEREREATRRSAFRWFAFLGFATLGVAIAAAVFVAMQAGGAGAGFGVMPLAFGGALIVISAYRHQTRWSDRVGRVLIPEVCKALDGDIKYQAEADRSFVKPYNALEMIGPWNRGWVKHLLRGEYRGRRFEMAHADLRARSSGKNSSGDSDVFKGLLFRIQTQANFEPGLSIRPNFGWLTKAFGKRVIPTGNKEFDALFLVSPDDGSALDTEQLNRVLTPDWQRALLALNETLGTVPITGEPRLHAGLKYDAFYMTLSLKERGRFRTLRSRPFPDVGHILATESSLDRDLHKLIKEIGIVYRVIEQLPDSDHWPSSQSELENENM